MKILAIILARKNSARLKNKNLLIFDNKPLFVNSINFAKKFKGIFDVIFSSDSSKMLKLAKKKCKIVKRPIKLSTSKSKSGEACLHALHYYEKKNCKVDAVLLLQPTTPFRKISDIKKAFNIIKKKKKSVVSVSQTQNTMEQKNLYYISEGILKKIKKNHKKFKSTYSPNGSFYLSKTKYLKKYKDFQRDGAIPLVIKSKKYSIDIDLKKDLVLAKKFLS